MTPSQAYAQWKEMGGEFGEPDSQSIRRFAQEFGIDPDEEEELRQNYPDQPQFTGPKKSGFIAQTTGAGIDELQKSFGQSIAGPGAELLADMGWEGGARFLEDVGTDIVKQQEKDLQAYATPQTREELIKEGGFFGPLYEHVLPEETQTPEQFGRQAATSLGAAGVALGAAGMAALAAPYVLPAAAGITAKAVFTGATAMVVGNVAGSFQVGGEEFESAKNDPFIRQRLGISPDANFADLEPDQQRALTDSAQRVAKDTMVERLYTSGALESLAFIPYGPLALRYVADIALGATSEELDKRLGMEKTIVELQRLGLREEDVSEMRDRIAELRPGTFETIWNAAIMEATFGSATAIVETVAQPDSRINEYLTGRRGESNRMKLAKEAVRKDVQDPVKLLKARQDLHMKENQVEQSDINTQRVREDYLTRSQKRTKESIKLDQMDRQKRADEGRIQDEISLQADYGMVELTPLSEKPAKRGKKSDITSVSLSSRPVDDAPKIPGIVPEEIIVTADGSPDLSIFESLDPYMHQAALNTLNEHSPEIDFAGATLTPGKGPETGGYDLLFTDASGAKRSIASQANEEGFVLDSEVLDPEQVNPQVYITRSMYDENGDLITDTDKALDRLVEVAFHESITHLGLRRALNAGTMLDDGSKRWTGEEYNNFIDGFYKRNPKMVKKWVKRVDPEGKGYGAEPVFRQVEEFLAANLGEAGGGKELGFFDNLAISIREANPFIKNSLSQLQVAKVVQKVVDQNAKYTGEPKNKKDIITGVELAGAIARGATSANLDALEEAPAKVTLREKAMGLPAPTEERLARAEEDIKLQPQFEQRIKDTTLAKNELEEVTRFADAVQFTSAINLLDKLEQEKKTTAMPGGAAPEFVAGKIKNLIDSGKFTEAGESLLEWEKSGFRGSKLLKLRNQLKKGIKNEGEAALELQQKAEEQRKKIEESFTKESIAKELKIVEKEEAPKETLQEKSPLFPGSRVEEIEQVDTDKEKKSKADTARGRALGRAIAESRLILGKTTNNPEFRIDVLKNLIKDETTAVRKAASNFIKEHRYRGEPTAISKSEVPELLRKTKKELLSLSARGPGRTEDETRFRSYGGKPKISMYDKPREARKVSGEDGYTRAKSLVQSYFKGVRKGTYPRELLQDLANFDTLPKPYTEGLTSYLKNPDQADIDSFPGLKKLTGDILLRGRENYHRRKKGKDISDIYLKVPAFDISKSQRRKKDPEFTRVKFSMTGAGVRFVSNNPDFQIPEEHKPDTLQGGMKVGTFQRKMKKGVPESDKEMMARFEEFSRSQEDQVRPLTEGDVIANPIRVLAKQLQNKLKRVKEEQTKGLTQKEKKSLKWAENVLRVTREDIKAKEFELYPAEYIIDTAQELGITGFRTKGHFYDRVPKTAEEVADHKMAVERQGKLQARLKEIKGQKDERAEKERRKINRELERLKVDTTIEKSDLSKRSKKALESLTEQERGVLEDTAEGMTQPEIGDKLRISPRNVSGILAEARRKFAKAYGRKLEDVKPVKEVEPDTTQEDWAVGAIKEVREWANLSKEEKTAAGSGERKRISVLAKEIYNRTGILTEASRSHGDKNIQQIPQRAWEYAKENKEHGFKSLVDIREILKLKGRTREQTQARQYAEFQRQQESGDIEGMIRTMVLTDSWQGQMDEKQAQDLLNELTTETARRQDTYAEQVKEADAQEPGDRGRKELGDRLTAGGAEETPLTFSRRQLPIEVKMRKMQIDRLPVGSPHRLNAIRGLQEIYKLNPVGEKFPAKYEEELKTAEPKFSWSARGIPKKTLRMLETGEGFTSPQLVRAIMGKRPEHINTVMRFLQNQRRRLLDGKMGVRDVAKAYAMTVVSQGMSGSNPWKVWDMTGGTRLMPKTYGEDAVKRKATLREWVEVLNKQHGREKVTEDQVAKWYNKAPLWKTMYRWEGYTTPDGKYKNFNTASKWETARERGNFKMGKMPLESKPQLVKNKDGEYVLGVGERQFELSEAQLPLWIRDPGVEKEPNTRTGAFFVDENYTDDRGFVRAEDGMAHWLATPQGQKALDALEYGASFKEVEELWRPVLDIRLAMGDDRAGRALFKDLQAEKKRGNKKIWNEDKGGWQEYNFSNIGEYVKILNEKVIGHKDKAPMLAAEAVADDIVGATKMFRNIDVGKEGFLKHLLGMGNAPTIDAIELNVWLAGWPDKSVQRSLLTRRDVAGTWRAKAISSFNKLVQRPVVKGGRDTYMDRMKSLVKKQFDKMRAADPESFSDIDPDIFYHTMHHWLWDRAKGLMASIKDPAKIGEVLEPFRPGVYQQMVPETERWVLTKRDVDWALPGAMMASIAEGKVEPGTPTGTIKKFDGKTLKLAAAMSKSARGIPLTDAKIKELQGKRYTRIPTDRFATGIYRPLFEDPDHPLNGYMMRGGVGYTLIPENMEKGVMWASDAESINSKLIGQVKHDGVTHGIIYLMTPDSHLSNRSMMEIYVGETQYMLDNGLLDADRLEARVQEIVDSTAVKWKDSKGEGGKKTIGVQNLLKEVDGDTVWEKLKVVAVKSANFPQRKEIITWLGGNVMASGKNVAEKKAGIKRGQFSGTWDSEYNVTTTKTTASYGAPLSQIYPRVTQSPFADNFSVVGISEFSTKFTDKDGDIKDVHSKITAEEIGVEGHPAYQYIIAGNPVAYWGEANSGVPADVMFKEWLPVRKEKARGTLAAVSLDLGLSKDLIKALAVEGAVDTVKKKVKKTVDPKQPYVLKEWAKLEKQIQSAGKRLKKLKKEIEKDVDDVSAALNAIRAVKVTDMMRGFGMSGIPVTMEKGVDTLKKFVGPDPDITKLYMSKSVRNASMSRGRFATNVLGLYGRWTGLVQRIIGKVEPLSKVKDRALYLSERQLASGQMSRWEQFGKSVHRALKDSKQPKQIYRYLTNPNVPSSIIRDQGERAAAEKAKLAIKQIGKALVQRKLLKQKTLDEFKAKHGDYLPRVYLQHLLSEKNRTQIAQGMKPSSMEYLLKRKDIPKGIRELVMGELSDQPGAPAYLASRASMVPGKDIALIDWMTKIKDISIQKGLNWVLPQQFVTFNMLEEARKIAGPGNKALMKELEMDVDLSGMSSEVTPMWLKSEGVMLASVAEELDGQKKKIAEALSTLMISRARKEEGLLRGVDHTLYSQMPDTARYGSLRGMWVHKQIKSDIIGGLKLATGEESTMERIFGDTGMMGRYNSYWKWAKVAANPPSWARNFMSNNVLLTLAGVPFWSIPGLNVAAVQEMRKKGKYYQIALDQGIITSTMTQAELGKLETDFIDVMNKSKDSKNALSWMGSALAKFMDKTGDIYGGIEVISKIGAIKYAMEKKGMNESQAAAFANKWLFDYGLVGPSVRYASTAVVGAPFIRFQSKAIPLMIEVMFTKPWRLAPYYALGYGMAELFKQKHDIDEDELDAAKMALAEWLREKAINGILPPNILPLPSLDDHGRWQIYDMSYVMPWGMLSEMASELQQGNVVDAMKTLGLMGGPLPDMLSVLKTGVDPFTRRPITDPNLRTPTEQWYDHFVYIMNLSTPSMLHSETGAVRRFIDAVTGELDPRTGEPKYTLTQASMRLLGTNIYPTNLVEQRRVNLKRMKWEISNIKSDWNRRRRGMMRSKSSRKEIQEAREEYRERLKAKIEERLEYLKNSRVPASLRAS